MPLLKTGLLPVNQGVDNLQDWEKPQGRVKEQINMFSTLNNVQKRAGLNYFKTVTNSDDIDKAGLVDMHLFDFKSTEYLIVHTAASPYLQILRSFDGRSQTVTSDGSLSYIGGNPIDYSYTKIADDEILILRKNQTPYMENAQEDNTGSSAVVEIKIGVGEQWYSVDVERDGYTDRTFSIQAAAATTGAPSPSTDKIAEDLVADLVQGQAAGEILEGTTITREGSTIYIKHPSDTSLSFGVRDTQGNGMMKIINNDTVAKLEDLTSKGFEDRIVHVLNTDIDQDDIYFKWDKGKTAWVETLEPSLKKDINSQFAIFSLKLLDNGDFYLSKVNWNPRLVGTQYTAPTPHFIHDNSLSETQDGVKIQDIFVFKNRLGILSSSGITFSRTGDFLNLFPKSSMYSIDTDPIDIRLDDELMYAIPLQNILVIFGKHKQYIIQSVGGLTPLSIAVTNATNYDIVDARPLLKKEEIYFLTSGLKLYKYLIDEQTGSLKGIYLNRTYDIEFDYYTNPIIRNLDDTHIALINSTVEGAYNTYEERDIIVYCHEELGQQILQDSWYRFKFEGSILLALVAGRDKQYTLHSPKYPHPLGTKAVIYKGNFFKNEDAHPSSMPSSAKRPYKHFDSFVGPLYGVTYDPSTNKSTLGLYSHSDIFDVVPASEFKLVNLINYMDVDFTVVGNTLELEGDYRGNNFYLGIPVKSKLVLPHYYLRDRNNLAITTGKTQLRQLFLYVSNTGTFDVQIDREGRDSLNYNYNTLSTSISFTDLLNIFTTKASFYIGSNNTAVDITIKSDTYYPLNIDSIEYFIQYYKHFNRR